MSRFTIRAILFFIILILSTSCATCPTTLLSYNDIGAVAFLPGDQSIVVVLHSDSTSNIYKIGVDGTGLTKLSENLSRGCNYVFSPDGSMVSYSLLGDIYEMKLDGTDRICLSSGPECDFEPLYSPDGSKIYFLRAQVFENYSPIAAPAWHNVDVYSANTDGTELKRITFENAYRMSDLSINSVGDTLMVMKTPNPDPLLMIPIANPNNKIAFRPDLAKYRERLLLFWHSDIDYNQIRNPRFLPDGNHVLFSFPFYNGLYVADLRTNFTNKIWSWNPEKAVCNQFGGYCRDGTPVNKVRQMDRMNPRISSDGQQVVFSTSAAPMMSGWESKIWVVNIDGTGLRSIEMR